MSARKQKGAKARKPTTISVLLTIEAPHATAYVNIDVDKMKTKQMPGLLRQLADTIEHGELKEEFNKFAGVHANLWPPSATKPKRGRK
jgi:hypothetical protein